MQLIEFSIFLSCLGFFYFILAFQLLSGLTNPSPNNIIVNIQSKLLLCFYHRPDSKSFLLCFITHRFKPAVLFEISYLVVTFALLSHCGFISASHSNINDQIIWCRRKIFAILYFSLMFQGGTNLLMWESTTQTTIIPGGCKRQAKVGVGTKARI